jgi:hypothetical protein
MSKIRFASVVNENKNNGECEIKKYINFKNVELYFAFSLYQLSENGKQLWLKCTCN